MINGPDARILFCRIHSSISVKRSRSGSWHPPSAMWQSSNWSFAHIPKRTDSSIIHFHPKFDYEKVLWFKGWEWAGLAVPSGISHPFIGGCSLHFVIRFPSISVPCPTVHRRGTSSSRIRKMIHCPATPQPKTFRLISSHKLLKPLAFFIVLAQPAQSPQLFVSFSLKRLLWLKRLRLLCSIRSPRQLTKHPIEICVLQFFSFEKPLYYSPPFRASSKIISTVSK